MKNIQIIDAALNCAYSIYEVSEETFALLFPSEGQDVEFIEDFIARVGKKRAGELLTPLWPRRIDKRMVIGIHGTLFFELKHNRQYYPNKRETDFDDPTIQRSILFGSPSRSVRPRAPRLSRPRKTL